MKHIYLILFLLITTTGISQTVLTPTINDALNKYGFVEGKIIKDSDTITYYTRSYKVKPTKLVIFIQGTDANPIFSYKIKNGKPSIYRWFGEEYKLLDSTYTYAIVPKPGLDGIFNDENLSVPKEYYEKNYLEYRKKQINLSIEDIIKKHLKKPKKIIVYGHSEGAVIGASLATENRNITHLGFWSGNVLNNFYEFSLFNRIETLQGKQTDSLAHSNITGIMGWYKSVIDNPNSTEIDHFGFTNKRWSSYEKPPIDDLLTLNIPIYAVFGTKDESTPIETAYLLPIQFMQKRKDNLTFEVCIDCNHAYMEKKSQNVVKHWDRIFKEFIVWTNKK